MPRAIHPFFFQKRHDNSYMNKKCADFGKRKHTRGSEGGAI